MLSVTCPNRNSRAELVQDSDDSHRVILEIACGRDVSFDNMMCQETIELNGQAALSLLLTKQVSSTGI